MTIRHDANQRPTSTTKLSASDRSGNGTRGKGAPPARAPNTGPARWILALVIFTAVMGSSLALKGILVDFGWFPRAAVVVAATLFLPALLRRRPGLSPFAPLGALAGWLLGLTMVFFPTTAILGIFPTAETLASAQLMVSEASTVIMNTLTPAPSVQPMFFLIAAGLGFIALLLDTLAITVALPAASSLGFLLMMVPSALMTRSGLEFWGFVGPAAGFLLVLGCCRWYAPEGKLRTDVPRFPSGTLPQALAMGAAVVLLMSMLPAVVPGFKQGAFPQGTRFNEQSGATSLDPMISLGQNLREQSAQTHLNYLSNTPSAQYIRVNTLEDFTGKSWRPSPFSTGLDPDLNNVAPEPDASPAIPRIKTLTWITPAGLRSEWLPAPAGTVAVEDLGGKWRWDPTTATIKGAGSSIANQSYVVHSEVPELTPARLELATGTPTPTLEQVFTTLPNDVPKLVSETAQTVAGNAGTPYAQAMALQNYLRSSEFSYSLDTPAADGYDGSGMAVLEAFLTNKSGYCVHFSAAMAVMARELGIPSRIAVGYAPGAVTTEVVKRDGLTLFGYRATGRDAHAWPELYFEGLGWVPFEPTPGRGSVPDYAQEETSSDPAASAPAVPTTEAAATPTTTSATTTAAAAPGSPGQAADAPRWLPGVGAGLLLVLLLLIPAMVRGNVRRRRLALLRTPTSAGCTGGASGEALPVLAWRELMDTATDFGYAHDASRTPALHAQELATMLGPTTPVGLALLRQAYEEDAYGVALTASVGETPAGRDDLADAVETVTARLQTQATLWGRIRARWIPASFFRRWGR